MRDELDAKRIEIVIAMKALKTKLEDGDDSQLLVWVLHLVESASIVGHKPSVDTHGRLEAGDLH
jgi:hypothetical protein